MPHVIFSSLDQKYRNYAEKVEMSFVFTVKASLHPKIFRTYHATHFFYMVILGMNFKNIVWTLYIPLLFWSSHSLVHNFISSACPQIVLQSSWSRITSSWNLSSLTSWSWPTDHDPDWINQLHDHDFMTSWSWLDVLFCKTTVITCHTR